MIEIIGVGHGLKKSVEEVRNKIQQYVPDIVALELDVERFNAVKDINWGIDYERKFSVQLNPVSLTQYLLSEIQRELGARFNILPGSEMKEAIENAKNTGAKIYLIDRDIATTITKLINTPFKEKFRLLTERNNINFDDLNEILDENKIKKMMDELKKFPRIYDALVEERNIYMAYMLYNIQKYHINENIIAVVGAGHKEGIIRNLNKIEKGEKIDLSEIQKKEKVSLTKILGLMPFVILLIIIYLIFVFTKIKNKKM